MKRCTHCKGVIVTAWVLLHPMQGLEGAPEERAEFCSHLCIFNWLSEIWGEAMQRMSMFRKGKPQ